MRNIMRKSPPPKKKKKWNVFFYFFLLCLFGIISAEPRQTRSAPSFSTIPLPPTTFWNIVCIIPLSVTLTQPSTECGWKKILLFFFWFHPQTHTDSSRNCTTTGKSDHHHTSSSPKHFLRLQDKIQTAIRVRIRTNWCLKKKKESSARLLWMRVFQRGNGSPFNVLWQLISIWNFSLFFLFLLKVFTYF
jgi:hypothetical protein